MAYVKKISADQFVFDCIKKQYELVGAEFKFKDLDEFAAWSNREENNHWFDEYTLTKEQDEEFRKYFVEHYYDYKPKRTSKRYIMHHVLPGFCLRYQFPVKNDRDASY